MKNTQHFALLKYTSTIFSIWLLTFSELSYEWGQSKGVYAFGFNFFFFYCLNIIKNLQIMGILRNTLIFSSAL